MTHSFKFLMGAAAALLLASGAVYAEGSIARAQFTTKVENRQPVDNVTKLTNDVRTVYFYTDLRGFNGQKVTHRWSYNGNVMANVSFNVRGNRWRVWSSKNLVPEWVGTWKVDVLDANGTVVGGGEFTYSAAASGSTTPAPAATSAPAAPASTPAAAPAGGAGQ